MLNRNRLYFAVIASLLAFALSACGVLISVFLFATDPLSAYTRVDRIGMPAIATAVISSGNKDAYNAADPSDDANGDFAGDITANVTGLHAALDDDLTGAGLVIPDTLTIDSAAAAGFPNGRTLADPVIDVTLALVLLDLGAAGQDATTLAGLPLNPAANDVPFLGAFPYLAAPHTP